MFKAALSDDLRVSFSRYASALKISVVVFHDQGALLMIQAHFFKIKIKMTFLRNVHFYRFSLGTFLFLESSFLFLKTHDNPFTQNQPLLLLL